MTAPFDQDGALAFEDVLVVLVYAVVLEAHDAGAGGAEFGHVTLAHQRELKAQVLQEALQRMAGIERETIVEALGREPERPAKFEGIEALPKRVQVMPADTAVVQRYITQHCPAA